MKIFSLLLKVIYRPVEFFLNGIKFFQPEKLILFKIGLLMTAASTIYLTGCSGFVYTNYPPLKFSDINYGFTTKTILNNPYISYIDTGKGEHTIVLIHGLGSNAGFWRYVIPDLSKKYRVIAIDLPGYGKSQKDYYSYNMSFFADQVKRVMDYLNINKFIFVGHSMGGQAGIMYALKYPQTLEKLILVSPAGFERFKTGEGDWLKSVMTVDEVMKTNETGMRKNLSGNFYSWKDKWEWMVEERARTAKAKDFRAYCYAVVRSVYGMLDEPTYNKLDQISVPTLVVYGRYDGLIPNPYLHPGFPKDVYTAGANQIPNCKLIQIDNCGHMVQIEKPKELVNAIEDFVK